MAALSFGFEAKPPPPPANPPAPEGPPPGAAPLADAEPVPASLDGSVTPCCFRQARNAVELKPEPRLVLVAVVLGADAALLGVELLELEPHAAMVQLAASTPRPSTARLRVIEGFTAFFLS